MITPLQQRRIDLNSADEEELAALPFVGREIAAELIHRRPSQWRPDVEQCFLLLQEQGAERLLMAFRTGLRQRAIGAEYVVARLRGRAAARGEGRSASQSHVEQGGRYVGIPLRRVSEGAP